MIMISISQVNKLGHKVTGLGDLVGGDMIGNPAI